MAGPSRAVTHRASAILDAIAAVAPDDAAVLRKYVEGLRLEAASYRHRLRDAEAELSAVHRVLDRVGER